MLNVEASDNNKKSTLLLPVQSWRDRRSVSSRWKNYSSCICITIWYTMQSGHNNIFVLFNPFYHLCSNESMASAWWRIVGASCSCTELCAETVTQFPSSNFLGRGVLIKHKNNNKIMKDIFSSDDISYLNLKASLNESNLPALQLSFYFSQALLHWLCVCMKKILLTKS